jgi:hypothetical protein
MKLRAEELSRIYLNINSSGYYREIVSSQKVSLFSVFKEAFSLM